MNKHNRLNGNTSTIRLQTSYRHRNTPNNIYVYNFITVYRVKLTNTERFQTPPRLLQVKFDLLLNGLRLEFLLHILLGGIMFVARSLIRVQSYKNRCHIFQLTCI